VNERVNRLGPTRCLAYPARKPGHCCVFCCFGNVPCPPVQVNGRFCYGGLIPAGKRSERVNRVIRHLGASSLETLAPARWYPGSCSERLSFCSGPEHYEADDGCLNAKMPTTSLRRLISPLRAFQRVPWGTSHARLPRSTTGTVPCCPDRVARHEADSAARRCRSWSLRCSTR
jgi:hypothetical protein